MPYRVYFVSHGYFSQHEGSTLEAAIEIAKKACFEATIYQGDELVAFWSPISGRKVYRKSA